MGISILSIESSCDDTSAAVIIDGKVASNIISTQTAHAAYGGVVPELASREHQIHIVPVVDQAIKESGISLSELSAIAFTRGPGLLGSLIVGVSFAKSLSLGLNIPLIDVHHMHAHVMAHFADEPHPPFPFLCLTVSGGHTQIVKVHAADHMEILGQTLDDAAGEAFDKTGKMLGLPYPAGPEIDKLAQKGDHKFDFPIAKIKGLDFSFSGLKTAILYFIRDNKKADADFIENNIEDICASVQETIINTLMQKFLLAAEQEGITHLAIAGGVSANKGLRERLKTECEERNWNYYIPQFQYCRDNAAMIGITGYYKYLKNDFCDLDVKAEARLTF